MRSCYIFDIDGTLADCSHRLHHIQKQPKDWHTFFASVCDDRPIDHMLKLVRALHADPDFYIVYVSGRSDECRDATITWLAANYLPSSNLYMRTAGDYRDDSIVKLELLAQIRADGYEPIMAFEDRKRVVAAWRNAGIPCAQVADGDF